MSGHSQNPNTDSKPNINDPKVILTEANNANYIDDKNNLLNCDNELGSPVSEEYEYLVDENGVDHVWTKHQKSEVDTEATEYFLKLRSSDKYRTLFDNTKFGRNKLWGEIAQEMNKAGFYVGEGREAEVRCRQKFGNLEKSTINYLKYLSLPGIKKKQPPQFYDIMVDLLDYESRLFRNMADDNVENDEGTSVRSVLQKSEIITLLKQQHAEVMKLQKEYLEKLDHHLAVQNEQRERMINSFVEAMEDRPCKCSRKRKRSSSNEST